MVSDPDRDFGGLTSMGEVHPGTASDAILGVTPAVVVRPATEDAVAALLGHAARARLSVVLRGAGTKLEWGLSPEAVDVVVDLRALNRVLVHAHGDLTATIQGGAAIDEVNRTLAAHRQWLPVETAFAQATIGGLLATNDSGPLRHRYGTPRDLLIGIRLATADGRLVKAGGQVVKNVAGYDLGKLVTGSLGSLAAIVSATFKLAPEPRASRTLVADYTDGRDLATALQAITASQLEPACCDLEVVRSSGLTRDRLYVRFLSTPDAVNAEIAEARTLAGVAALEELAGDAEAVCWQSQRESSWAAPGVVVKLSWRPAAAAAAVALLDDVARTAALEMAWTGRAAVGTGFLRLNGPTQAVRVAIGRLRGDPSPFTLVVLRAPADLRAEVDVWGPPDSTSLVRAAIKRAFDPEGVLVGRGPA